MKRRELRAVFFDIDDTLYSTTEFAALARRNAVRAMRRHGLNLPPSLILKELHEVISEFSSNYEHHFEKLLVRIPRRAYEGVNPAILVAAAVTGYHETKTVNLRPYEDVPPVLKWLAGTDLIRGIVTSGLEVKQAEKLIRLGVYRWLTPQAIFISDQIGISKPNPKLYHRACEEMGVLPEEAMYVGDHPANDVDPPRALGMITVLVKRNGKHARDHGRSKPDYTVRGFGPLKSILQRDFGVR